MSCVGDSERNLGVRSRAKALAKKARRALPHKPHASTHFRAPPLASSPIAPLNSLGDRASFFPRDPTGSGGMPANPAAIPTLPRARFLVSCQPRGSRGKAGVYGRQRPGIEVRGVLWSGNERGELPLDEVPVTHGIMSSTMASFAAYFCTALAELLLRLEHAIIHISHSSLPSLVLVLLPSGVLETEGVCYVCILPLAPETSPWPRLTPRPVCKPRRHNTASTSPSRTRAHSKDQINGYPLSNPLAQAR